MKNFFKKLFCSDSMSKHFSETVKRVGKNNAGFSLVELIVVIAIMAILAAVAVIGVSVYIPYSQKAGDEQMLSDIEDALMLYYYSDPSAATDGVLVLNVKDDAYSNNAFIVEALKATYGDDWASELTLQYGEWNATFQGSNYFGDGQELADLLGTVETLTEALGGFLDRESIADMLGDNFNSYMEDMGATTADQKADAAVFYVADITAKLEADALHNAADAIVANQANGPEAVMGAMNAELGSTMASAATLYALAEGFANFFDKGNYDVPAGKESPRTILNEATADIEASSGGYASTAAAFGALLDAFKEMAGVNPQAYADYMAETDGQSPLTQDLDAYAEAMKTVSNSKNDILSNNGADLGTDNYFTSTHIKDLVDTYSSGGIFVYVKVEDNGLNITTSNSGD